MHIIPGYSMLFSTGTTLILSLVFLILSHQSNKNYMRLWGISWLIYSSMFLLDFLNLQLEVYNLVYIMFRQALALIGSHIFFLATHHFFQRRASLTLNIATALSLFLIILYPFIDAAYTFALIPNIIYCSGLLVYSGCMFISYTWTQNLPEKLLASFFIILWGVFINHFGFSLQHAGMAILTYFIGIFTVNVLILYLIIIYFKKTSFLNMKQAHRFRLLVENSSDAMFLYDYKTGMFEYVSPAISELIGVTHQQLYKMPDRFFDLVNTVEKSKDILSIFSAPITKAGRGLLCLYEHGVVVKWSEVHYLPIVDALGTVIAVEGILRDITERKNMEEDLRATEEAKKQFLEDISHEIKTPVTLIQGYTESLLDKVIPPEYTDNYLKMVNSKAKMLTTLVDDLAQSTNFSSQTLEYKFYEYPAQEVFEELVNQSEFQIAQSGHQAAVSYQVSPSAVLIVDPYRIQQVISNLINNSIRHTPLGKEISISCHTYTNEEIQFAVPLEDDYTLPEGELVFTVSDQGDGIPEKDLPHIFQRKFSGGKKLDSTHPQAKTYVSSAPSRSGLGLFISMQIVEQHSGRMWAQNNQYGGAEIAFALPFYMD